LPKLAVPLDSWADRTSHPVVLATGLVACAVAATVGIGVLSAVLLPDLDDTDRRLIAVLALMTVALCIVVATNGWRRAALRGPSSWRAVRLLAVPAAVALVAIHAIGDLLLHTTNLAGGALWGMLVAHDRIVLLWGLRCLRRVTDDVHAA